MHSSKSSGALKNAIVGFILNRSECSTVLHCAKRRTPHSYFIKEFMAILL